MTLFYYNTREIPNTNFECCSLEISWEINENYLFLEQNHLFRWKRDMYLKKWEYLLLNSYWMKKQIQTECSWINGFELNDHG